MAALLYTHTYGVFSWFAHGVYILGLAARDACARRVQRASQPGLLGNLPPRPPLLGMRLVQAIFAGTAALALYSAWIPVLLMQGARAHDDFWTQPVTTSYVLATVNQICLTSEFAPTSRADDVAGGCLLAMGLAALLWRGRAGEWTLTASAVLPLAASVLVSVAGTPVLAPHYLIFAQSHLLVGMALVLARARGHVQFAAVTCVATAAMLVPHLNAQHLLRIDAAPGARGAAPLIDQGRARDEPLVVCIPLYYLPVVHHLNDRERVYRYRRPEDWPRYHGTAVLTDRDYITAEALRQFTGRVWVIDMERGGWGTCLLEVPPSWKQIDQHAFREPYPMQGEVVVRLYEASPGTQTQHVEQPQ